MKEIGLKPWGRFFALRSFILSRPQLKSSIESNKAVKNFDDLFTPLKPTETNRITNSNKAYEVVKENIDQASAQKLKYLYFLLLKADHKNRRGKSIAPYLPTLKGTGHVFNRKST